MDRLRPILLSLDRCVKCASQKNEPFKVPEFRITFSAHGKREIRVCVRVFFKEYIDENGGR